MRVIAFIKLDATTSHTSPYSASSYPAQYPSTPLACNTVSLHLTLPQSLAAQHSYPLSSSSPVDIEPSRSTSSLTVKANRVIPARQRKHLTLARRFRQPLCAPERFVAVGMRGYTGPRFYAPDFCFGIVRSVHVVVLATCPEYQTSRTK